jgi:glucose/arabinose dehydrogenase
MQQLRSHTLTSVFALAPFLALPAVAQAATVTNPLCSTEKVLFNPDNGSDIFVPPGFTVSKFASGLNAPTGIAFLGNKNDFQVFVLESGHGLPSRCNDQSKFGSGDFDPTNPFTPDILVFDKNGNKIGKPLAKPTGTGTTQTGGLQAEGPAIDIAFERGLQGGRLFATDSNQSLRTTGNNNSSRIVIVNPTTGAVTPFITALPTGDHPSEQLAFKGGWIYWSQGSTTNSGVVGLDNGGGANQPDIPCQDITLSNNLFDSGGGKMTSGYSPFNTDNRGKTLPAFTNGRPGVCDGATLRARLNDPSVIEPVGWGHRNGYAIRFAPDNHPLGGQLLVGEDGADERGARPSNGAPEVLSLDQQNPDGTPVYHGWPDRYGFLPTSQAVFNPVGGPGDDLCVPDSSNPPSMCTPASLAKILSEDVPIRDVLAFPPQPITAPLAIEAADSSFTGIDFVPKSFVGGPVERGAALYSLEGDFGFSAANGTPEVGHEVKLINFGQQSAESDDDNSQGGKPLALQIQRFAHNKEFEQSFISGSAGFNRPTNIRFGPDGCAYVADYGAVRDFGQSDPASKFTTPGDGPLVQFPGTGVIWKICPAP